MIKETEWDEESQDFPVGHKFTGICSSENTNKLIDFQHFIEMQPIRLSSARNHRTQLSGLSEKRF